MDIVTISLKSQVFHTPYSKLTAVKHVLTSCLIQMKLFTKATYAKDIQEYQ